MACGSSENLLSDAGKLASGNDALCHLSKSGKLRRWGFSPSVNTTGGVPHREAFVAQHGEEGAYSIHTKSFPSGAFWMSRWPSVAPVPSVTTACSSAGATKPGAKKVDLPPMAPAKAWSVGNDTDWRSIAGDADFGATYCAIKTSGQLWCWGSNRWDQLGQGEDFIPSNDSSPIQVGTDTDWAIRWASRRCVRPQR